MPWWRGKSVWMNDKVDHCIECVSRGFCLQLFKGLCLHKAFLSSWQLICYPLLQCFLYDYFVRGSWFTAHSICSISTTANDKKSQWVGKVCQGWTGEYGQQLISRAPLMLLVFWILGRYISVPRDTITYRV